MHVLIWSGDWNLKIEKFIASNVFYWCNFGSCKLWGLMLEAEGKFIDWGVRQNLFLFNSVLQLTLMIEKWANLKAKISLELKFSRENIHIHTYTHVFLTLRWRISFLFFLSLCYDSLWSVTQAFCLNALFFDLGGGLVAASNCSTNSISAHLGTFAELSMCIFPFQHASINEDQNWPCYKSSAVRGAACYFDSWYRHVISPAVLVEAGWTKCIGYLFVAFIALLTF